MPRPLKDRMLDGLIQRSTRIEGAESKSTARDDGFEMFQDFEYVVLNSLPQPEIRPPTRPYGSRPAVMKGGKPYPWMKGR